MWVALLATVSVEELIDDCQPASKRLPEANFQSNLGHIPLGSLWQLHRGTPRVCFPSNSQHSLSEYRQIVLVTELRSEVVLWETSRVQAEVSTVSRHPATFTERMRQPIINQDPRVASGIHAF